MANPVLIAAPVAILPAVAALWYLLKRYEAFFDDARVFMSLTIGFFAGLLVIALERLLFPFEAPEFVAAVGPGTAFLFFVIGYALFETAAKLVVLGSGTYRGRKDTPYYGAPLGLGMGTMLALGFIAINLNVADAIALRTNQTVTGPLQTPYGLLPFISMALLPIGAVLAHGATGVWVGRSTAKGQLWQGWLIGAALQAPVLGMFWLFHRHIGQANVIVAEPGLMSIVYGALLLHITRKRVLDHVVPKEIMDRVRRDERRKQRLEEARLAGVSAQSAREEEAYADVDDAQAVEDAHTDVDGPQGTWDGSDWVPGEDTPDGSDADGAGTNESVTAEADADESDADQPDQDQSHQDQSHQDQSHQDPPGKKPAPGGDPADRP